MSALAGCRPDVIVVGAGAAGAAAAFHLARLGREVMLCDGAAFPRRKPCGGGMAASVQRWFPFDLSPAIDTVIERVRFSWALQDPVLAELPGEAPFWIVRRSRLDAFLTDQGVAAGVRFEPSTMVLSLSRDAGGWRVLVQGPDGAPEWLRSRAVVVADGSGSRLAGPLGLGPRRPRFASTVSVELEGPLSDPAAARFDFGLVRQGFCWAFPRQGGYSIGLGTFVGRDPVAAEAVLTRLLPSLGFDPGAGVRSAGQLRLWDGHHALHGEGVLLAGDAASLCDPFLAEGLRPALLSGCQAAMAIDRWLAGEAGALAAYTATMRREWGESMAWGRRMAQVFYRVPRVGYQLGIKRPTAPRRIAQILSGEMGYGDIAQRVIRRLLLRNG